MNMMRSMGVLLALAAGSGPLAAASYNGTINLVQASEINGVETARFYIAAGTLSLYAKGIEQELLREALVHKAYVSVGYTPISCPPGILGSCGDVTLVTLSAVNVP